MNVLYISFLLVKIMFEFLNHILVSTSSYTTRICCYLRVVNKLYFGVNNHFCILPTLKQTTDEKGSFRIDHFLMAFFVGEIPNVSVEESMSCKDTVDLSCCSLLIPIKNQIAHYTQMEQPESTCCNLGAAMINWGCKPGAFLIVAKLTFVDVLDLTVKPNQIYMSRCTLSLVYFTKCTLDRTFEVIHPLEFIFSL